MNSEIAEYMALLQQAIIDDDIEDVADEVVEELESRPDAIDAIEPILRLIENNPDADFGAPGALVHFVERFLRKGYEDKLVASVIRRPVFHTLWMINRIINGTKGDEKKYYLTILDNVIAMPNLEDYLIERAQEFRSLHE